MPNLSRTLAVSALAFLSFSGAKADPEQLTCVDNQDDGTQYTSATGEQYDILCGLDYNGGDIASTHGVSFEQCIEGKFSKILPKSTMS